MSFSNPHVLHASFASARLSLESFENSKYIRFNVKLAFGEPFIARFAEFDIPIRLSRAYFYFETLGGSIDWDKTFGERVNDDFVEVAQKDVSSEQVKQDAELKFELGASIRNLLSVVSLGFLRSSHKSKSSAWQKESIVKQKIFSVEGRMSGSNGSDGVWILKPLPPSKYLQNFYSFSGSKLAKDKSGIVVSLCEGAQHITGTGSIRLDSNCLDPDTSALNTVSKAFQSKKYSHLAARYIARSAAAVMANNIKYQDDVGPNEIVVWRQPFEISTVTGAA